MYVFVFNVRMDFVFYEYLVCVKSSKSKCSMRVEQQENMSDTLYVLGKILRPDI
jgi:hypothetical protein